MKSLELNSLGLEELDAMEMQFMEGGGWFDNLLKTVINALAVVFGIATAIVIAPAILGAALGAGLIYEGISGKFAENFMES